MIQNKEKVKNEILELLNKLERKGSDKLIEYLKNSDFFEAPGSTQYHCNYDGGLAEHSLNVYKIFKDKVLHYELGLNEESIIVMALFHDSCKINFYKKQERFKKNDKGRWITYEGYVVEDEFPVGHGEKSIIMLQNFIRLSQEEILAIRWHMGFSEAKEYSQIQAIGNAYHKYKSAALLHIADMEASYMLEDTIEIDNNDQIKVK